MHGQPEPIWPEDRKDAKKVSLIGKGWPDGMPLKRIRKISKNRNRRRRKWEADQHCHYCGRKLRWEESTLDHVIPRSKGGDNSDENTVIACVRCNQHKAAKLEYWGPPDNVRLRCERCDAPAKADAIECLHGNYWLCPSCASIHKTLQRWARVTEVTNVQGR